MSSAKIHTIILGLILIQCVWAKPLNDTDSFVDSTENLTFFEKLQLYSFNNLFNIRKHMAANAVNVSRYILKDQDLVANTKPEVVQFKTGLTTLVEMYETRNLKLLWDIPDSYSYTTDHYLELEQEKVTPESAFIIGILNKYNAKDVDVKLETEMKSFLDSFEKKLEANKTHLEKPLLDWYEKYSSLESIEEKIDAFGSFVELIK